VAHCAVTITGAAAVQVPPRSGPAALKRRVADIQNRLGR